MEGCVEKLGSHHQNDRLQRDWLPHIGLLGTLPLQGLWRGRSRTAGLEMAAVSETIGNQGARWDEGHFPYLDKGENAPAANVLLASTGSPV